MKTISIILIIILILGLGLGLGLGLKEKEKEKDKGGNTEKAAPNLLSGTDIFNLKQTEGFGTGTATSTNEFGYLPRFNSNPVYADNKWVAIGYVGDVTLDNRFLIYYSDDGSKWQKANNAGGISGAGFADVNIIAVGNNIAYGGGSWVAVGTGVNTDSTIYYSDNAVSWYPAYHDGQAPFGSVGSGVAVAYNGSSWVAVGRGTSSTIYYSDNAVSWYPAYHDGQVPFGGVEDATGVNVAYNGSSWVAVGKGVSSNIYYSDNAVSWYPAYHDGQAPFGSYGDDGGGYAVAYNGSSWVAVGVGTSSSIYYSDNAVSWYPAYHDGQAPFGGLCAADDVIISGAGVNVVYNGSSWVAVGAGTSADIYYSDNAVSWYPASIEDDKLNFPDKRILRGICFADGNVVIGAGFTVFYDT